MEQVSIPQRRQLPVGLWALCILFSVGALLELYGLSCFLAHRHFVSMTIIGAHIVVLLSWVLAVVGTLRARRYGWLCAAGVLSLYLSDVVREFLSPLLHRLGLADQSSAMSGTDLIVLVSFALVFGMLLAYICRPSVRERFGFRSANVRLTLLFVLLVSAAVSTIYRLAMTC